MLRLATPSLLLTLAVSACVVAPAGGPSPLEGKWRVAAIDGAAPVDPAARVEIMPDRLSANVGCNGFGGPWRVEGGRLIAGPLIGTKMWCEGRMEQESAMNALLTGAPEISAQPGRLRLTSGGHSAELVRQ